MKSQGQRFFFTKTVLGAIITLGTSVRSFGPFMYTCLYRLAGGERLDNLSDLYGAVIAHTTCNNCHDDNGSGQCSNCNKDHESREGRVRYATCSKVEMIVTKAPGGFLVNVHHYDHHEGSLTKNLHDQGWALSAEAALTQYRDDAKVVAQYTTAPDDIPYWEVHLMDAGRKHQDGFIPLLYHIDARLEWAEKVTKTLAELCGKHVHGLGSIYWPKDA